jgi:hypothetical protein
MKTGHIFVISTLIISGTFFGILSLFNLPESVTEWVISDIILGAVLYVNYLVIVMGTGSSKTKVPYSSKKVTA